MTRLKGMTLKRFGELVEDMRKTYPFEDEKTVIIDTRDDLWDAHMRLDIYTYNKENDVHVRLSKGIDADIYNWKGGEHDEDNGTV